MKISIQRGYTIMELLVALLVVGVIALIVVPISLPFFAKPRESARRANCQSNLKQLGLAMMQYSQDYQEKFPPFAIHNVASSTPPFSRPYGWADAIELYAKNLQILQCPSESHTTRTEDATQSGFTDYWFNTNLNARALKEIASPAATFLLGEGNDGRDGSDARYNRDVLPQSWLAELPPDSEIAPPPAQRHLDFGNYLFADGHVKALKPQQVVNTDWFAVRRQ